MIVNALIKGNYPLHNAVLPTSDGTNSLHLQSQRVSTLHAAYLFACFTPEDRGSMFLWNICQTKRHQIPQNSTLGDTQVSQAWNCVFPLHGTMHITFHRKHRFCTLTIMLLEGIWRNHDRGKMSSEWNEVAKTWKQNKPKPCTIMATVLEDLSVLTLQPRWHQHVISYKTWNVTFNNRRVPSQHMLIH